VVGGGPRFPTAVHHVHAADWAFFGSPERICGYTARGPMAELERRGLLRIDEADGAVAEGVRVMHAPGHTPGHRVAVLESGGRTLVLTGDLLHTTPQVRMPQAPSSHDEDAERGCRSRAAVLGRARDEGWDVAVSHFGNPFGRVGPDGWTSGA
jgi:glyoxylase-like metal-dependent hydrolase (beta-lactamase superfamily II)